MAVVLAPDNPFASNILLPLVQVGSREVHSNVALAVISQCNSGGLALSQRDPRHDAVCSPYRLARYPETPPGD